MEATRDAANAPADWPLLEATEAPVAVLLRSAGLVVDIFLFEKGNSRYGSSNLEVCFMIQIASLVKSKNAAVRRERAKLYLYGTFEVDLRVVVRGSE